MRTEQSLLRPRLIDLATATGLLLPRQIRIVGAMLYEIDRLSARRTALERATAILDAGQGLSRWALAQRLEKALARFAAVGMKRVESGHRPLTELEKHLLVLLESGPRCSSKLWLEIRDLPERG